MAQSLLNPGYSKPAKVGKVILQPVMYTLLLLSMVQQGWSANEQFIHFGRPFADSITLKNESSDTAKITGIEFQRISGSDSDLFFEFKKKGEYYLSGIDRDLDGFLGGIYKPVTDLTIPPKSSVVLSQINIGHLPLQCPCEDALASYPNPHAFRILFSGNNELEAFNVEGDIYSRPSSSIKRGYFFNKGAKYRSYRINGQRQNGALFRKETHSR